jgi:hypothetical protein
MNSPDVEAINQMYSAYHEALDLDFDFGVFDEFPGEAARCRRCGWVVQPDMLQEHRNDSCPITFGDSPDPGFPLPPRKS